MTEIVLFHSALGLRADVLAFAEDLREKGQVVHAPDYYDSETFVDLDSCIPKRDAIGFD